MDNASIFEGIPLSDLEALMYEVKGYSDEEKAITESKGMTFSGAPVRWTIDFEFDYNSGLPKVDEQKALFKALERE